MTRTLRTLCAAFVFCTGAFAQQEPFVEQTLSVEAFKVPVFRGAVSANGTVVAVTSTDKIVKLVDAGTLTEKASFSGFANRVSALAFSSSGQLLVTGGFDGQVIVLNTTTNATVKSFSPHSSFIVGLNVQDENIVVTAGFDKAVKVTDALSGKSVGSIPTSAEDITALALSSAGKVFAVGTATGQVRVYSIVQLSLLKSLLDCKEKVSVLALSNDGKYVAAGTYDGSVYVWDTQTFTLKGKIVAHKGTLATITFDPKSRWILTSAADSSLKMFDLATLSQVKSLTDRDGYFTFTAFLNDEVLVAGTSKGFLKRWKVLPTPPDTANPVIVMTQPTPGTANSPTKVYAKEYEVRGVAYDDSEVKEVLINGAPMTLLPGIGDAAVRVPAGAKAVNFKAIVKLETVGLNTVDIKVADKYRHSVSASSFIQRLSNDQALEVQNPANNSETEKAFVQIQFKSWFDVSSYSISVNLVDIVSNQATIGKGVGDVISDEVPLVTGYNQINLSVMGKSGERFSKTLGVSRKSAALTAAEPAPDKGKRDKASGPQKWAVVVGVSEYTNPGIPSLKYADKDAEAFANFLRRPEGGSYNSEHMRVLLNKDATLSNIRDALMVFLQQAIDIDLVVIYFAGHGAPDPTRPQNLYLLTNDSDPNKLATTAFPMWDIQTVMSRQLAAKKSIIFSDACHSGGISVDVATRGLGVTEQNPINQFLVDLAKAKEGSVIFTASAAGEVSQEFPDLGHGAFTYYLLEGLEGKADYNNDYTVTINELMQYVEEQVKRKTRGAQNPTRSQTSYDKDLPIAIILK